MSDLVHYSVRGSASHSRSIGITQRATPLAWAWTGDQRVRFTDFQVNEIGQDGSVVHLRSIGLTEEQKRASQETPAPASAQDQTKNGRPGDDKAPEPAQEERKTEVAPEDVAVLSDLAGGQFAQRLVQLFRGEMGGDGGKAPWVTSDPVDDKSKRAQIHGQVRRIFQSRIDTTTDASGAISATRVPLRKGKKRNRGARGQGEARPAGEYLHFTLYKDNRDTMDAVNLMARALRLKPQLIGYAGTKDRRASTAQRCSVRYARLRALAGVNGKFWGITTGDYEYRDQPIHLGQLLGNEFVITLKNCRVVGGAAEQQPVSKRLESMKTQVQAALDHMAAHGWINYFGPQRFGTHQTGTHEVGKLIIGGKWEDAVKALLSYDGETAARAEGGEVPSEALKRDEYARHQACMLFLTGKDPERAARVMPARFTAETCVLRHLTRGGSGSRRDYAGALMHITRGLRSMYLHAYQSYVWNHVASRRWELHGAAVVKGDLVVVADGDGAAPDPDPDAGDDVVNPGDEGDDAGVRTRPLTADEAASGRFSIRDVVLPSPGFDVTYPDNDIGRFYDEFMARPENGGLDPRRMRRLRREFSLPGRYRKLLARFLAPPAVDLRLYADDTQQMHPTDLDVIAAAERRGGGGKRSRDDADADAAAASKRAKVDAEPGPEQPTAEQDEDKAPEGAQPADSPAAPAAPAAPARIAAVVKFQLGSSAYATVALREFMGDLPDEADPPTGEAKPGDT